MWWAGPPLQKAKKGIVSRCDSSPHPGPSTRLLHLCLPSTRLRPPLDPRPKGGKRQPPHKKCRGWPNHTSAPQIPCWDAPTISLPTSTSPFGSLRNIGESQVPNPRRAEPIGSPPTPPPPPTPAPCPADIFSSRQWRHRFQPGVPFGVVAWTTMQSRLFNQQDTDIPPYYPPHTHTPC